MSDLRLAGAVMLAFALAVPARAGKRYESFLIDPVDMTAVMGKPAGVLSSSKAWFERSETGGGARIVDQRDDECRGTFDFAAAGPLFHRSRALNVLEGPFGRVYARFDYWYPPERVRVAVNTSAGRRDLPHREPVLAAGSGPAESFALIRVLKAGKKFKIATADYGLDGGLRALRVDVSSGDWASSEVAFSSSPFDAGIWGLPASVDAKAFASKPFAGVAEPVDGVETEAALIYRARGVYVERFTRRGSRSDRDWLAFPVTEIERSLAKREAAFPFTAGPGR
ncbi:MAG: hypothetical protein HY923_11005 [Elusimicrobia bacterium]|nr:hypothetical protein [Elusimicrobiota bacterium]